MKTRIIFCLLSIILGSSTLVAQTTSVTTRTQKTEEKNGFTWTKVKTGDKLGAEVNGRTVVPCKYDYITYNPGFFDVCNYQTQRSACYKEDGTCIIPESRGYTSISSFMFQYDAYISVYINKAEGACDSEGREIFSPKLGYEQVQFDKDDKEFCRVKKNGNWGLYNIQQQKEVISTSLGYTQIVLHMSSGKRYYGVTKNEAEGAYDMYGKEIIPTSRGYSKIVLLSSENQSYYSVKKNNLEGACDMDGNEIVEPKYEDLVYSQGVFKCKVTKDRWESIGIRVDGSRIPGVTEPTVRYTASTSSSASSSTSSSSTSSSASYNNSSSYASSSSSSQTTSSSQYGNILFQGTYTCTGVVRNLTSITGCGQTFLENYTIYEQAFIRNSTNEVSPFVNYVTIYGESGRRYGNGQAFYLVTDQGMIRLVVQAPTDITVMYFDKGDTRNLYTGKIFSTPLTNGGNYNNNSVNYGGTYNQQHQRRCSVCHGTGLCSACHGSKMVTNSFGYKGLSKCNVCNFTGLCTSCGGTGRK